MATVVNKMIKIAPLRQAHYTAVSEIYKFGIDSKIATFTTSVPDFTTFDLSHIKDARWVAMIDSVIVGWAALAPTSTRHVYRGVAEVSIYIHPAYQHQGIGKLLMNHAITESEKLGIWTLVAGVISKNVKSVKFHLDCGFRIVGIRERIGWMDTGEWMDVTWMERRSLTVGI
jgi:L-amino acid N-acyltransferase YncA